jgi:hypothetical protein
MIRNPKMNSRQKARYALKKMLQGGFRGYPLMAVGLYGPTASRATKLVLSLFRSDKEKPDVLERWFSEDLDVRQNDELLEKIFEFQRKHKVKSLAMPDQIIGCPHEEGIDYPEGKSCPKCPYWAGRDRYTGERVH